MTNSAEPLQTRGEWLRMQRQARGWSVPEMRRHLRDAARETGDTLPNNECLGVMIRRWEKNEGGVSERYRLHYCRTLGIPFENFGTASPPATAIRHVLAEALTTPATPPPLDEDERAELKRLRDHFTALAVKHDKLLRGLIDWALKIINED